MVLDLPVNRDRCVLFARKVRLVRLAVLDVGSNTVHLVIVDGQPDGTFTPVARERETLRLAEAALPTMLLPEEAVERLTATVARMRDCADELGADALVGFATSAIREARTASRRSGGCGRRPGWPWPYSRGWRRLG